MIQRTYNHTTATNVVWGNPVDPLADFHPVRNVIWSESEPTEPATVETTWPVADTVAYLGWVVFAVAVAGYLAIRIAERYER